MKLSDEQKKQLLAIELSYLKVLCMKEVVDSLQHVYSKTNEAWPLEVEAWQVEVNRLIDEVQRESLVTQLITTTISDKFVPKGYPKETFHYINSLVKNHKQYEMLLEEFVPNRVVSNEKLFFFLSEIMCFIKQTKQLLDVFPLEKSSFFNKLLNRNSGNYFKKTLHSFIKSDMNDGEMVRLKKVNKLFRRIMGMKKKSYPIKPSIQYEQLNIAQKNKAHQVYASTKHQNQQIKEEDLSYVNDWVNYRIFDQYLSVLITTMVVKLDLPEDTKKAFVFNTERAMEQCSTTESWIYFGGMIIDEMEKLSFAERVEILMHRGHQKSQEMKQKIIETEMINTLKEKKVDFDLIYNCIVEKTLIVIDLIDIYEINLNDFVVVDDSTVKFGEVLKNMSIEQQKVEVGDRLDLEKCKTIDVCITEDLTKELTIKEIVQKGMTVNGELYRKTSVIVYRWEES